MVTYRVVLCKNSEYKKTLYRSRTRESSFIRYNKLKEENKTVIFPRKFVNTNKIEPVEYRIYVVKDTESTDQFRILRNKLGKLYTEKPMGSWTILDSSPYNIEETFWLYGHSPVHDRKTIQDIMKPIMNNISDNKNIKQVIVVHNKLVIYNELEFNMVICKCQEDAQRLHHRLYKATNKNKIKGLIYMGTATKASISNLYEIIQEKTGWRIQKIRRTTTRP